MCQSRLSRSATSLKGGHFDTPVMTGNESEKNGSLASKPCTELSGLRLHTLCWNRTHTRFSNHFIWRTQAVMRTVNRILFESGKPTIMVHALSSPSPFYSSVCLKGLWTILLHVMLLALLRPSIVVTIRQHYQRGSSGFFTPAFPEHAYEQQRHARASFAIEGMVSVIVVEADQGRSLPQASYPWLPLDSLSRVAPMR